jgi:hypothetical protein
VQIGARVVVVVGLYVTTTVFEQEDEAEFTQVTV